MKILVVVVVVVVVEQSLCFGLDEIIMMLSMIWRQGMEAGDWPLVDEFYCAPYSMINNAIS